MGLEAESYYIKDDNKLFRCRVSISNREVLSKIALKLVVNELQYKVKNYLEEDDENEDETAEMRF